MSRFSGQMNTSYREAKRLKILDRLIIAKGRDKIIFKNPKTNKHLTIKTDEQGIVDAHITEESKPKKYESILRQNLDEIKKQLGEIFRDTKVNLDDSVFDECTLAILPVNLGKEAPKICVSKGKSIVLSKEMSEEIGKEIFEHSLPDQSYPVEKDMLKYLILIWRLWPDQSPLPQRDIPKNIFIKPQDAGEITFTKAFVFKSQKFVGFLIKRSGNYFFISLAVLNRIYRVLETKFGKIQNGLDEILDLNSI